MLNIDRSPEIVAEARSWIGTPYRHQGRTKGARVDCVGLILGVGKTLDLLDISPEDWKRHAGYSTNPNPRLMGEGMRKFLAPLPIDKAEEAPDGAIAWLAWREDLPMHLAIMGTFQGRRTMIHAASHSGACVEHGFVSEWPDRVVSWWAYPKTIALGDRPDDRETTGADRPE